MKRQSLIIIGGGPRGLGILERLSAIITNLGNNLEIDVHLIDPAEPGQGCHPSSQADYLLTNTVAAQATMFSDPSVQNAGPVVPGPSFQEWANQAGYREAGGRFVKSGGENGLIKENDYLPRSLLGQYLSHVFDHLAGSLPPCIHLHHHRCEAVNINFLPNEQVVVQLEGGFSLIGDFAILTTGHTQNRPSAEDVGFGDCVLRGISHNPRLRYISQPYPMTSLQSISSDSVVGIQGIGLTTYDVVAVLTEGRGGHFEKSTERVLSYHPSGREPKIVVYSRQGLPFCSRAVNEKGIGGQVQAKFFTRPWIDQLRKNATLNGGTSQLDFERDLWPVLLKEMCFAYHTAKIGATLIKPSSYEPDAEDVAALQKVLYPFAKTSFEGFEAYVSAVRAYMDDDLSDAFGGNLSNSVKAATDILRDVRDNLRYAVDFSGLTPESHACFLRDFTPIMNRVAVGPPKERNMQLAALIEAGVVSLGPGPSPVVTYDAQVHRFKMDSSSLAKSASCHFDVLVRAKIDAFYPEQDASAFFTNALASGVLRPYRNGDLHPGGIDIDHAQNIVDGKGRVHRNVWALGTLAEGPNFYTYVLPRPMVNSRFIQDAGTCILSIVRAIQAKSDQSEQSLGQRRA